MMKHRLRPLRTFFCAALLVSFGKAQTTIDQFKQRQELVLSTVDKVFPAVIGISSVKTGPIGSGVIISSDGLILTAGHVTLAAGDELIILLHDGREVRGESLGAWYTRDAAMARITTPGEYPFVRVQREPPPDEGEWVVAMGHTAGFQPDRPSPVRVGRVIEPLSKGMIKGYIKTDCTLAGGDSGGPLFNLAGHLIGIHSQIGFNVIDNMHVPMSVFVTKWDEMEAGQRSGKLGAAFPGSGGATKTEQRAFLGVAIDQAGGGPGVLVKAVVADAAAATAGVLDGDRILKVDGTKIADYPGLVAALKGKEIGSKIKVLIKRGEETLTLPVLLGSRDVEVEIEAADEGPDFRNFLEEKLGKSRAPEDLTADEVPELLHGFRDIGGKLPAGFDFQEWLVGGKSELNKESSGTMTLFTKQAKKAKVSIVEFVEDGKRFALGTAVGDGLVLTKFSELRHHENYQVRLADGSLVEADIKRGSIDREFDLALVEVLAENLQPAAWSEAPALPGMFLSAPSVTNTPHSIGVVAVGPRSLQASGKGFLGVDVTSLGAGGGVYVNRVVAGCSADLAGIRERDVIISVQGKPVNTFTELLRITSSLAPDTEVKLHVARLGIERHITLKLGSREVVSTPHPFMDNTIRMGGKLSKQRSSYPLALEHDLTLSPDEIGGPLLDLDGNIVGINIARAGRTRCYAIPSRAVTEVLAEFNKPSDE